MHWAYHGKELSQMLYMPGLVSQGIFVSTYFSSFKLPILVCILHIRAEKLPH